MLEPASTSCHGFAEPLLPERRSRDIASYASAQQESWRNADRFNCSSYDKFVTFSGSDAQLLGRLGQNGASKTQTYLLQRIVRSVDPDALLSHHASALTGMATGVPRAQAALLSHGENHQPTVALLGAICRNAEMSVNRSLAYRPNDPLLRVLAAELFAVPASVIAVGNPPQRATAALRASSALYPLLKKIPTLLKNMFMEAWILTGSKPDDWNYVEHVSDELGSLIAASDRDVTNLKWQLPLVISKYQMNVSEILDALLPLKDDFHVACLVRGAKRFSKINALDPTAQQTTSRTEDAIRWGPATERLRNFISELHINAEDCVISIDVDSVDKTSAARLGRRRVTELLDQYVAGHRLLRVSLARDTLVARVGTTETEKWQPSRKAVHTAYPLVDRWPDGLRETLRMSHVARDADSPLTAAALSWVAIEASGVNYSQHKNKLARALSLQALRQQIVETYQLIKQSETASRQYSTLQERASSALVRSLEKAIDQCPVNHGVRDQLILSRQSAIDDLAEAERRTSDLNLLFSEFSNAMDAHVSVDESTRLNDLNQWVDLLLPARDSDSSELFHSRQALTEITKFLSPLAARQMADWQRRLKNPIECGQWLSNTQERMEEFLDILYSTRNLSLHSGVFSSADDTVLGQAGVMLVDFMLEFLGNWYRNTPSGQNNASPLEVISRLSDRQAEIVSKLTSGSHEIFLLNIARLTSPSSIDGWDRP